ncbi:response regulator transcription factor [Rhodovastum atsumiense]|nr:response regulator [Rhodovastum atsumiense]
MPPSSPPPIPTVFVVDDDKGVRDGLAFQLRSAGLTVQTYEAAEAFLADRPPASLAGLLTPACLLTDVCLPGMDGVELVERLARGGCTPLPIVVISGHAQTPLVVRAMRAGAADFLEKPLDPEAVMRAVRTALGGAATPANLRKEAAAAALRVAVLSPREREVLNGFAQGAATKQIAGDLGVSAKTVETYRTRLQEKLGVDTTYGLARVGVLAALFSPIHAGPADIGHPPATGG